MANQDPNEQLEGEKKRVRSLDKKESSEKFQDNSTSKNEPKGDSSKNEEEITITSLNSENREEYPPQLEPSRKMKKQIINLLCQAKKNANWLIPLLILLLALSISTYFRVMPTYLPITEKWAEETVFNSYRAQISNEVNKQYPVASRQNNLLAENEFQEFIKENDEQIKQEITNLSQYYKNQLQDEDNQTYLLEIDPYLWYSEARNIINYGHPGDELKDGQPYFSLRNGRVGIVVSQQLHPEIIAYFHKFIQLFDKNSSLIKTQFFLPVIIMNLAIIPLFFIARKIAGNIGGLFAAIFLAINSTVLLRTSAGFADTDGYNLLFPLLVSWLILEAYTSRKEYVRWGLSILAGSIIGIYSITWGGWSFIFFIILATLGFSFAIAAITAFIQNKYQLNISFWKQLEGRKYLSILAGFLVSSTISSSLLQGVKTFFREIITSFSRFTILKKVAVTNIWPGVHTTVAEFQSIPVQELISKLGGKIFVLLSILGVILTLQKREDKKNRELVYFILLTVWLTATAYGLTKGLRFIILLAPAYALALGSVFGTAFNKLSWLLHKKIYLERGISRILVLTVLGLFLITPFSTAQEVAENNTPLLSDAWYTTLTKIKQDSKNAIITSWWDFGHWFTAIAERKVTFDGGDQKKRIHWVGKLLLTTNEAEAIGILRMLNCAQELAVEKLDEFTEDNLHSIQILYQVFSIANRDKAHQKYQELGLTKDQAATMLKYTHCDNLIPNYLILSEDMIRKSRTWAHFGSWNFQKSDMYFNTKQKIGNESIIYLTNRFNLTVERANAIHQEILTIPADQWIAPFPRYGSALEHCKKISDQVLRCSTSIIDNNGQGRAIVFNIDLNNLNVTIKNTPQLVPHSLVYAARDEITEKTFSGKFIDASIILVPDGEDYQFILADQLLATSMFTKLFFFNGLGTHCFTQFNEERQITGDKIITWKIDYNCQQKN